MNYKEKLELKKEIIYDIYSCFSFNLDGLHDFLSMDKMSKLIDRYNNELIGIEKYENSNQLFLSNQKL